jgi:predicted GIY-YIG superfamily endonuclease
MVSHPHLAAERTALYRLHDGAGVLLYIGITHDPESRWRAHAGTKSWWPEVIRKEVEWHADRLLAETAEVAAIRAELPVHNVDDSPIAPRPRLLGDDEVTMAQLKANLPEVIRRSTEGEIIWTVGRNRARTREAAVVPVDLGELIQEVGGVDSAVAILKASQQGATS